MHVATRTPNTHITSLRHVPSVLNVEVIKFKQTRVRSESNHDPLKVAKSFVRTRELQSTGKENPGQLDSCPGVFR